eukprot:5563203-Amphidinium_carterae.1
MVVPDLSQTSLIVTTKGLRTTKLSVGVMHLSRMLSKSLKARANRGTKALRVKSSQSIKQCTILQKSIALKLGEEMLQRTQSSKSTTPVD